MKYVQTLGFIVFLFGFLCFNAVSFMGKMEVSQEELSSFVSSRGYSSEKILPALEDALLQDSHSSLFGTSASIANAVSSVNTYHEEKQEWGKRIYDKPYSLAFSLGQTHWVSSVSQNPWLWFFLTFGLCIIGGLLFVLPTVYLLGAPGIKNDHIYHHPVTNKGWIAILFCFWLVLFYVVLYFYPSLILPQTQLLTPISELLSGNIASQWFLYGFMYTVVMLVMGAKIFIKYRHNNYQKLRTIVVVFFQVAFAFLIPEILVKFNMPYMDFKNAFPLDYDFFFDWNLNALIANGNLGIFMIVWGIALTLLIVPIMVFFFGKRWYCSWVCGCGGLAETLGDPFRQHSSKSLKSWKFERYIVHAVLVLAIVMTAVTLDAYFAESQKSSLFGFAHYDVQRFYGFWIGSIFSGVIGTGLYPIFGNRVWCRFGCPLAAYMGLVQRFKSRFRITTNGGQCISCGNCSTYCEQGIDVRSYAQKGQNIVRASCVGCGVCAAVCPRGVLKLENGADTGSSRTAHSHITLGNNPDLLAHLEDFDPRA